MSFMWQPNSGSSRKSAIVDTARFLKRKKSYTGDLRKDSDVTDTNSLVANLTFQQ